MYASSRAIFVILTLATNAWSATITVCRPNCTTASLQEALDKLAACGDTIQIKTTQPQTGNFSIGNRGCAAGQEIVVTTDRVDWLPQAGTRVTPSHLENLGIIQTTNANPAISGRLDDSKLPPNGYKFIGIGFTSIRGGTISYNLVHLSGQYVAADNSQLPYNISFDRCYFYTPLPNGGSTGVNIQKALFLAGSGLTVSNSFFGDIAWPGVPDTNDIYMATGTGAGESSPPINIVNNYFTTSAQPIFTGGRQPDFGSGIPSNIVYKYNFSYRPWKWNNDPRQPFYSDFLANSSYFPCQKSHGEFKLGDTILWQYNVGENTWKEAQCQSQFTGFTTTVRTGWDMSKLNPAMGTISTSDPNRLTWSGTYKVLSPAEDGVASIDYAVCVNVTNVGVECRDVSSFDNQSRTLMLATPLSSVALNGEWWICYTARGRLVNFTLSNNVFRNTSAPISLLGYTASNGVGSNGHLQATIRNNLFVTNNTYVTQGNAWNSGAGEGGFIYNAGPVIFDHNTIYSPNPFGWFFFNGAAPFGVTSWREPKWNLTFTNNLFGQEARTVPFGGDSRQGVRETAELYFVNSSIQNNVIPGDKQPTGCTGTNTCTGNIVSPWTDPFGGLAPLGIFRIAAGSAPSRAGLERTDIGANFDQLPLITNLRVTAGPRTALLEFDLNAPIADAGNTQPCVLEVSSNRNLHSDLNIYEPIHDLDPFWFKQPDTSKRSNPKLAPVLIAGSHVAWPMGDDADVVPDNPALRDPQSTGNASNPGRLVGSDRDTRRDVPRDLRLAAETDYYGRVMCYGDTQMFSFKTAASPVLIAQMAVSTSPGTAEVRVLHGKSRKLEETANFPVSGSGTAQLSIPVSGSGPTLYQLHFLKDSKVTYKSPILTMPAARSTTRPTAMVTGGVPNRPLRDSAETRP